ncbi:SWIB/MDM2 domain-containing protein [Sphingomonas radiodurans]|uniref:SWIB/MDM2 domain-containing protein n=1 Tax=Sphingomonas radiodurans TaxID=2890321 RepID=UPI001FD8880C|nr:SWIB/MDM2 domain-containing protein [Sphingomonas radiodurans]WBH16465.1 SWIB/MDM2 domain-containing protein [Sphingomonas radiodurans]
MATKTKTGEATKTKTAGAAKAKTATTGDATKPKTGGIHAPVQPSPELGAVVGNDRLPRSEVISKVWAYIKSKDLQNPENKREILADDNLKKVFGKDKVTMFEMNKYISAHVKA